jgi:SNF2 family DNA or RNA helicase
VLLQEMTKRVYILITDYMIRNLASNDGVYLRGIQLYNHGRVKNPKFNPQLKIVEAEVEGDTGTYNVIIDFEIYTEGEGNDLKMGISNFGFWCECKAAQTYKGFCKHAVALLKAFAKGEAEVVDYIPPIFLGFKKKIEEEKKQRRKSEFKKRLEKIRSAYARAALHLVSEVEMKPNVYIKKIIESVSVDALNVRFKIYSQDINKEYFIKNIGDFSEAYMNKIEYQFGKKFVFKPFIHVFPEQDRRLLEYIYKLKKVKPVVFAEQYFNVPYPLWEEFFSLLDGQEIFAVYEGDEYKRIKVDLNRPVDIDIFVDIDDEEAVIKSKFLEQAEVIDWALEARFVIYQDTLTILKNPKNLVISPLYYFNFADFTDGEGYGEIRLNKEDLKEFFEIAYPIAKECCRFEFSSKVKEFLELKDEELKLKVLFDTYKRGICAHIKYTDGFADFEVEKAGLQRERVKEIQILSILLACGFEKDQKKGFVLEDEEKIFNFVMNGLPVLMKVADVYYSETFKSFKVKKNPKFSVKVSLNHASIDFWLSSEDILQDELPDVLASLEEKKRYHRLKDGTILLLDSPELEKIQNIVKDLDISKKDLKKGKAIFSKFHAIYLSEILENLNLNISKDSAFDVYVQKMKKVEDTTIEIPGHLDRILREYQKVGVRWLSHLYLNGFGGILADDMGLGKTVQVLSFISACKDRIAGPCLVVAPTSLVYNWQQEAKRFTPNLKTVVVDGTPAKRSEIIEKLKDYDIVITSYSLLKRDIDLYKGLEFSVCVVDEAQHIKNPQSLSKEAVSRINAKCCFALTGTPIENNLSELWSIFDFVLPGYLGTHTRFSERFEKPIVRQNDEKALKLLQKMISPFVLRRLKKDVLSELPEKIETNLEVSMTPEQENIYKLYLLKAREDIKNEIEQKGFEKSKIKIFSILTRLRQICCHPKLFLENYEGSSGKLELFEEILEDVLESGHRAIVFSQWTEMLRILEERIKERGFEYFYLDGSTKSEERIDMANRFNSGQKQVFLVSLKAGGFGLNLTGADVVILYDLWWNPAVESQAMDRAHRIGQENSVQVFRLITKNTIEERIFELQQKKKDLFDTIIQSAQTFLTQLSEDELMQLLEE